MDASFNASKRYSDKCKWICIYPLYLNARKTIAHGRRISKQKVESALLLLNNVLFNRQLPLQAKIRMNVAVDSPTSQEIYDVLTNTGFKVQLEKDKMHPLEPNRDPNAKGRVRVQLHNDDGTPFNEKFPTSRYEWMRHFDVVSEMSVMLHVCEMIPKLKNRQAGGGSGPQTTAPGVKTSRKNKKR
uniref:Uncharacterized protein n=1 Tax=Ascaris lumbricoides TaxID=6252 RepID=A0A9J2P1G3_ASCLU